MVKIVCIDPRETRTSVMSHWHLQPKPGTDAALALGMMNEIVKIICMINPSLKSYNWP